MYDLFGDRMIIKFWPRVVKNVYPLSGARTKVLYVVGKISMHKFIFVKIDKFYDVIIMTYENPFHDIIANIATGIL
jgi:hypothetical protein